MYFAEWGNINVYSSPACTDTHITLAQRRTTHMNLSPRKKYLILGVTISTLSHFGVYSKDLHPISSLIHYLYKLITVSPNMGKCKNPPSLSKKNNIHYWTTDATLLSQVSKAWLTKAMPLNQHNNTLTHIKNGNVLMKPKPMHLKQEKTVGVLLHSNSEILQYPALG